MRMDTPHHKVTMIETIPQASSPPGLVDNGVYQCKTDLARNNMSTRDHGHSRHINRGLQYTNTATENPREISLIHEESTTHEASATRLRVALEEWTRLLQNNRDRNQVCSGRSVSLTLDNQWNNQPRGDALQAKDANVTRVYTLNLNGILYDQRGGQFDTLCKTAKEVQADIICCQEHNVDTTQQQVRHTLYNTVQQHWGRSRLEFGMTPITFETPYKPGGTLIMSVGNIKEELCPNLTIMWDDGQRKRLEEGKANCSQLSPHIKWLLKRQSRSYHCRKSTTKFFDSIERFDPWAKEGI